MPPIKAEIVKNQFDLPEAQREQYVSAELQDDIKRTAEYFGTGTEHIENEIKTMTADYAGGIMRTSMDIDDTRRWMKQNIVEDYVNSYQEQVDAGIFDDEDPEMVQQLDDMISQLKDEYNIGKSPIKVLQESTGDFVHIIGDSLKQFKEFVSVEENRNELMKTVSEAGQKAALDVPNFMDALAVLSANAVFDEVPTGIGDLFRDMEYVASGGKAIRSRAVIDLIPNESPFSGTNVEMLKEQQPVAAVIAGIVPFALQSWQSAKQFSKLKELRNSGQNVSRVGAMVRGVGLKSSKLPNAVEGALKIAKDEATLGAGYGVSGESPEERNASRGLNAAIALLAGLGVEAGFAGVRKLGYEFEKQGLKGVAKVQAVQEELMNRYQEVLKNERPVSLSKINEAVDKYGIKPINKKVEPLKAEIKTSGGMKVKETEVPVKTNIKRANRAIGDKIKKLQRQLKSADKEKLRNGDPIAVKKDADLRKQIRTLMDEQDALNKAKPKVKRTVQETEYTKPVEKEQPIKPEKEMKKAEIKKAVEPQETKAEAIKRAEQDTSNTLKDADVDPTVADIYAEDEVFSPVLGAEIEFVDKLTALMGNFNSLQRLRKGQTTRLTNVLDGFDTHFHRSKNWMRKASNRATFTYNKFAEALDMNVRDAVEKYLDSGVYRAYRDGLMSSHPQHGTLAEFIRKYGSSSDKLKRGEFNLELNQIFKDEVLAARGIRRSEFKNVNDYIERIIDEFADPKLRSGIKYEPDAIPVAKPRGDKEMPITAAASVRTTKTGHTIHVNPNYKHKDGVELLILHELEHINDGTYATQRTLFKRAVKHFRYYNDSDFAQRKVFSLLDDVETTLTDKEIAAFNKLAQLDENYNRGINLKIFKEIFGEEVANEFSYDAYTDSVMGRKLATISIDDNPTLREVFEREGVEVISLAPTRSNPNIPKKDFVIFDYGDDLNSILNKVETGKEYYQRKFPELFTDGVLNRELFTEEHNISFALAQLEKEFRLRPEQVGKMADQLRAQGYNPKIVQKVMDDLISGVGFDTSSVRKGVKRMFVGSLQKKQNQKAGVNLNVISARQKQNVMLTKKLYRDNVNERIDEMLVGINKVRQANTQLDANQTWRLDREEHILNGLSDMVNNRPSGLERILLNAVEAGAGALGLDSKAAFKTLREITDQHLALQSTLKLAGNISGSTMNILEALRVTADSAFEIPNESWKVLHNSVTNPAKFVKDTHRKMARSKKYKMFYLEDTFDAAVDTRFSGKKTLVKNITNSTPAKIGMAPFTNSIQFGKVFTYNIGEQAGRAKGLRGQELDDFIFDFMSQRSQIQDLNVSVLSKNDTVVKSVFWLKNFMLRMSEYEIDNWAGMLKGDKAVARRVFTFSVLPAAAFGVGTSPSLQLLNKAVYGLSLGNYDPMAELESGKLGTAGKLLSHGLFGSLTNISTRQMQIDLLGGLNQKPIMVQDTENIYNLAQHTFENTKIGVETGRWDITAGLQLKELEQFAAMESVLFGRTRKALGVYEDGVLSSVNGFPIESNIPEGERSLKAMAALFGYNTADADSRYTQLSLGYKVKKGLTEVESDYANKVANLISEGKEEQAKVVLKLAEKKGYEISDKMIQNRLDKKQKTRVERFIDSLTDSEYEVIHNEVPALLEDE